MRKGYPELPDDSLRLVLIPNPNQDHTEKSRSTTVRLDVRIVCSVKGVALNCAPSTAPSAPYPQHCTLSTALPVHEGCRAQPGGLHSTEACQLTSSWNEIPENIL